MVPDRFSIRRLDAVGVNLVTTVLRPNNAFYEHLQSLFASVSQRHPPRTTAWVRRKWRHYSEAFSGSMGSDWVKNLTLLSMLPTVYRRRFQDYYHPESLDAAREISARLVFNPDHYEISDATRTMFNELRARVSCRLVAMAFAEVADVGIMLEAWPELTRWFERIYVLRDDGCNIETTSDVIVPCSDSEKRRRLISGGEIGQMFRQLDVTARRYLHVGSHWQTDVLFARNAGSCGLLLDYELNYLGPRGGWRRCGREELEHGRVGSTIAPGRLIVVNNHADATSIILNTARAGTKRA